MKLSKETTINLKNYKLILFKDTDNPSMYYDVVFFLGNKTDQSQLFDWLKKSPKPTLGSLWQSLQLGFMGEQAVGQISKGYINIIDDENSSNVVYFYLNEGNNNLTSNGSSGSLVLSDENQPLGVLQCKENLAGAVNLRGNSDKWYYRAISINSIVNKDTELFESINELSSKLESIIISEKQTEGACIPVDRTGAGGQYKRFEGNEND